MAAGFLWAMQAVAQIPYFAGTVGDGKLYGYSSVKARPGINQQETYTTFQYGPLSLSSDKLRSGGKIEARVTVTNTGSRAGDEIVQMYIHDTAASIARPIKELKGFRRIHLEPGEQQIVTFEVDEELLKFYNADLRYVAEPGEFTLMVGPNSEDLQSKAFVLE